MRGGQKEAMRKSTGKGLLGARAGVSTVSSCEITEAFRVVWADGFPFTQKDT